MTKPSHFDLVNQHGAPLCHAVACRKHTHLRQAHGGIFCPGHLRDINEIRSRIVHVISSLFELQREVEARREELAFRKIKDPGHERYLRLLENHLAFQYAAMNPN